MVFFALFETIKDINEHKEHKELGNNSSVNSSLNSMHNITMSDLSVSTAD